MKLNYVYKIVTRVMNRIDSIDIMNLGKRKENQKKLNEAYTELDNFKDELIRENIKNKQGGHKRDE